MGIIKRSRTPIAEIVFVWPLPTGADVGGERFPQEGHVGDGVRDFVQAGGVIWHEWPPPHALDNRVSVGVLDGAFPSVAGVRAVIVTPPRNHAGGSHWNAAVVTAAVALGFGGKEDFVFVLLQFTWFHGAILTQPHRYVGEGVACEGEEAGCKGASHLVVGAMTPITFDIRGRPPCLPRLDGADVVDRVCPRCLGHRCHRLRIWNIFSGRFRTNRKECALITKDCAP